MKNLTLEQQFSIRQFNDLVDRASREQLQELIKDLFVQNLQTKELLKETLKNSLIGDTWKREE